MSDIDASTDTTYMFTCSCLSVNTSEVPVVLTENVSFCSLKNKLELRGKFLLACEFFVGIITYLFCFMFLLNAE